MTTGSSTSGQVKIQQKTLTMADEGQRWGLGDSLGL